MNGTAQDSTAQQTVLVVEDNQVALKLISTFLRKKYRTIPVDSAREGLSVLGSTRVDLIISDMLMPQMTGLELARKVRENPKTREIPILFCTAVGERDTVLAAAALGNMDYVVKPLNRRCLLERVARLLAQEPAKGADGAREREEELEENTET